MAAPSLDNEFMKYWEKLSVVQKESLISVAKNYIELQEGLHEIDIEQYNKEIADAMTRMDNGQLYTHEQVVAQSKSWLNGKQTD